MDSTKMGLQGHSFGGYETVYIITHTDIFAAACSASAMCDLIGWYGSAFRAGYSIHHMELGQGRMGGTPWEIKDLYIANSPIMNADKVSTPLLMMHNKEDMVVPYFQGVEFFTALRRLGKKVWMLQYDGEGHSLEPRGKAAKDFTIRMCQFFDFYLNNALAPRWMTVGLPAKLKGVEDALDYNSSKQRPQ